MHHPLIRQFARLCAVPPLLLLLLPLLLPLLLLLAAPLAHSHVWPSKPVRIIVPFAAGSFTETAARAVGAELSTQFGQPFIIETRGGAGSTLGTDAVAKSTPDGVLVWPDGSSEYASRCHHPIATGRGPCSGTSENTRCLRWCRRARRRQHPC